MTTADARAARTAWLTTLQGDRTPHTTPIWFVLDDATIWIASSIGARKVQNLLGGGPVSLAVDGSGADPQVALGTARVHRTPEAMPDVLAEFAAKYDGWDAADPTRYGPRVLIEITVSRWLLGGP